ncbi:hypothetical protein GUJ93_ZPchr0004g39606 [Zizania palustris]|uniref:Mixed lineage kinase domain-containing protein n=1 Tax=Zizania palustris TaxID=103762 RepID=A0A8J5V8C5_ZIZPA|nr:hypothetical protein GUJ93_ZPchr0004g39606 [Zizania palustris]
MEGVSFIVGGIIKVAEEIGKALNTARRNDAKCEELARRARQVAKVLRRHKAAAARTIGLSRLKEALDDAFDLTKSYRLDGNTFYRFVRNGELSYKFEDVNRRITDGLVDLFAEMALAGFAARDHRRADNLREINARKGHRKQDKIKHQLLAAPNQRRGANNSKKEINASKNGNKGGLNKGKQ